ncbi:MAG: signal peptidase II [Calditrichaeota bacterium]|nr:MAG: signal peptidase II [Calditrichota bacterium]
MASRTFVPRTAKFILRPVLQNSFCAPCQKPGINTKSFFLLILCRWLVILHSTFLARNILSLFIQERTVKQLLARSRFVLAILIIVTSLGCDQATKKLAQTTLPRWHSLSFFGDTVRLQYVENPGVAFSIGAQWPENVRWWLFSVGQGLFLLILAAHFLRNLTLQRCQFFGFALILGGGFGNFFDRIFRDGRVIDFLNIGFGNLRTAIFNVADISITTGLLLLIYGLFLDHIQKKEDNLPLAGSPD